MPRKAAPTTQSVTLRFQTSQLRAIEALAKKKGTSRSAIIQLACAEKLEREAP